MNFVAYFRGVRMNRRVFQLFRAWVPSWRFFETLSEQAVLQYRVAGPDGELGEWQAALQRPARTWYSMVLNGPGNAHLAQYTLLDQLEEDISELDPEQVDLFSNSPSYQLVQNLVCYLIRERQTLPSSFRYQFKVSRMLASGSGALEEILVSPVHTV